MKNSNNKQELATLPSEASLDGKLSVIEREIHACTTFIEQVSMRDRIRVYQSAAAIYRRNDLEIKFSILFAKVERQIAKTNPPIPKSQTGRGNKVLPQGNTLSSKVLCEIRAVHDKLSDDEFQARIDLALRSERVVTRKFLRRAGSGGGENRDFEWYTPAGIIESARLVMGSIDLDPASNSVANEVVKADTFYTQEDDGLSRDWYGNVFMNPPYARGMVSEFCNKLVSEDGNITQWIVLINCISGTPYFHRLLDVSNVFCFVRGFLRFGGPTGSAPQKSMYSSAIIGRVINTDLFRSQFSEHGYVLST